MRHRDDIQEDVLESNAKNIGDETVRILQLEVLLDIRDQNEAIRELLEGVAANRPIGK